MTGVGDSRIERVAELPSDGAAFYKAVSPHLDSLNRLAATLAGMRDRDDVVQEALVSAWRHRSQFDPARGTLGAWLATITAHEATRLRRRLTRGIYAPPSDVYESVAAEDGMDLARALTRLTKRERLAVDCYYFSGLSVAETAAVMGCSEGTVKSTLSDARRRLRALLE